MQRHSHVIGRRVSDVRLTRGALANPLIDFGELEFPELAHLSGGQTLPINPSIDGVLRHPEVLGEVVDGNPRFGHRRHLARETGLSAGRGQSSSAKLIRQQSQIVADSRTLRAPRRRIRHWCPIQSNYRVWVAQRAQRETRRSGGHDHANGFAARRNDPVVRSAKTLGHRGRELYPADAWLDDHDLEALA